MICKVIRRFVKVCAVALATLSVGHRTFAQEGAKSQETLGTYHSAVDELLTVEKVTVLPFTDNLQGIYSRPLEAHLISLVDGMHRWNYIAANTSGPILAPEELEDSPEKALQVSQGMGVDAFFAGRVTKGPNGVTVHISLFLSKDGKLLSQAILKDYKQFDLPALKEQVQRLLSEIVNRLPYAGRVLSRDGNRVTVNLGGRDGVQVGQMLSVIQIIQMQRHPKFNFLVRTDKEIFGKIKVLKVDDTLSFGAVITEKEKGAIQKNAKIGSIDFVTYSGEETASLNPVPEDSLSQRDDGKIAFGQDAHAWKPQSPPTFGQVGGRLAFSLLDENTNLYGGVGPLSATGNIAASIMLEGELWITPEWTFHAHIGQGIAKITNPMPTSSPGHLNQLLSSYEAGFGYMFRLGPHIWSPYIEPKLTYFSDELYSDASTPLTFTNVTYSGFKLGVRGASPLDSESKYGVGGEFEMAFKPVLSESPVSSGASATNNVIEFGVFGYQRLSERLKAQVELDFEMLSTNFTGVGSRGSTSASTYSQRMTTLSAGIYYMF